MPDVFKNPFLQIKIRSYLFWSLLSLPLLIALLILSNSHDETLLTFFGVWFHFVAIVWIYVIFRKHHVSFRALFGTVPKIVTLIKYAGITFFLLLFSLGTILLAVYVLTALSPKILSMLDENIISTQPKTATPMVYLITNVFFLVIGAPIIEELFFRGVLLHRLATKWGVKRGIIFSSAIFAILHQNENIIGIFMFGVVLSLIYLKTKSLFATIFCHMLNNGVFSLFFVSDFLSKQHPVSTPSANTTDFLITGIILLIITLPVLLFIIRKYWALYASGFSELPYFVNKHLLSKS